MNLTENLIMEAMATKTDQNSLDQSVYIADQDVVKIYPRSMSNDEIDYDIQTNVKGKSPQDYYLNFRPMSAIQEGFKHLVNGGLTSLSAEAGTKLGKKASEKYMEFEEATLNPALKLAAIRPDIAFGRPESDITPEQLALTYKPWLDIWKDSAVGKVATGYSDKFLVNAPAPIAAIPWFVTEFVPEQLLEFGTKPTNWVGAYGVEKIGPPVINAAVSKLPKGVRETLLKDIFNSEKAMQADFDTLGISPNTKTSEVIRAYKDAAKYSHPDVGGSAAEFNSINTAYTNIMKSRGGVVDKFFDMLRGAKKPSSANVDKTIEISGFLGNQRGSALIPFGEGEIVKVGQALGQVVKISGKIATVNIAGKVSNIPLESLTAIPKPMSQESAVNMRRLEVSGTAEFNLRRATDAVSSDIENQIRKTLGHEEIIEASKEAEILKQGISRESTLEFEASLLKTRQHLAALAEQEELTPEFLDTLKIIANTGSDIARSLESLKIEATPEFASVKIKIVKDLIKLGKSTEEIMEASKGVDWKSEKSVAQFYRKFVKPKMSEMLDEYAYMNILSSPLTHIVNSFSNMVQLAGINPLTKLASGGIDFVASKMTGAERAHYVSEVPSFYKGVANAFPKAFSLAVDVMKGKKNLERPDIKHIPTLSKAVDLATLKLGKYVTRALEASDVLFRTMIEAGEVEALSSSIGRPLTDKELIKIKKEASKRADYYVFRSKPDADNASGQGNLLSGIDQLTNAVYRLRAVPGLKWFIRFVQTPMNILKQGIEYSPLGITTLKGAKDKKEQAGKAAIGSLVFAGASWLASNNLITWAAPTGEKEKNEFYAAGLQPYSVRMGDKWVSYSKIGVLAYPLAMAASLHYYTKESQNALSDSEMDKVVDSMTGLMKFFSDQSYLQGIGDLISFAKGEKMKAVSNMPTQLVPLSSLQGWVNQIMDELHRKPSKGLTIESVTDQIKMKIVGMSQFVPPQIDSEEVPVKKQMRVVNAFSPIKVSKVNQGKLAEYRDTQKTKQEINKLKKELS